LRHGRLSRNWLGWWLLFVFFAPIPHLRGASFFELL
jgi:hypothetical protein